MTEALAKAKPRPQRKNVKGKRAEAVLHESEERLRLLANNAPIVLFAIDRDGVFTLSEGKGLEALGLKPGELVGRSIFDAFPDLPDARQNLDRVLAGEAFTFTAEVGGLAFEAHCAPARRQDGEISGIIGAAFDVTERKRAEEALHKSDERLRAVMTNAPVKLFVVDRNGVCTLSEGKVLERLGLKPGEAVGRSVIDLFPDTEGIAEQIDRALAGEAFTTEVELAGVTFEIHCAPLRDGDGDVSGIIGVGTDITERKRMEEALRESEAKYRQIFENVQDIYYRTSIQGLITEISPSVERFGYNREELIGTPVTAIYETPGERSALLRMILKRGEVTDYEIRVKTADGRVIDGSLNAHLLRGPDGAPAGFEGSIRDISRRKQAEEALRESEERLSAVMTNVPVMLFAVDRDGVFTLSEGKGLEVLGLKPGEVVGRSVFDAFPGVQGMAEYIRRALDGEAFTAEVELAGSTFEAHCAPLRDLGGQINGLIGVATDISERKRMEEALRDSEQKFHRVFKNVPESYYRTDAQGIVTDVSPSIERYGFPCEEIIGKQVLDFYGTPEERSVLLQALFESGEVADHEIHLTAADGRLIDTSVCTYVLRGPNGEFAGVEGTLRDVSERKRMEEALRESEAKYRQIFENVQDIYYQTSIQGIITDISPSAERFGYTREELIGTPVTAIYETPGERSALLKVILKRGEVTDYEIRVKAADGRVIDGSLNAHLLRGPDGAPVGFEGSIRDISGRKRAEEALKKSEERLRTVIASVPVMLFALDRDGVFTLSEGKGLEALGLKPGELVGMPVFKKFPGLETMADYVRRALDGETLTVEVELADFTFETYCAPLRDRSGQVSGVIGVATDVSERKRMEEALKQTATELERSNEALRETEEKFRRIFDNVQDIYYRTDDKGIITEISPSVRRFGNDPDELIGTPVLDMYKDPDERSALMKALFEQGVVIDFEVHLKSGDGLDRTTSVSTHLLHGPNGEFAGVEGSLRDVTERKRMEKALRESEAKYRQIFESVQDVFYQTDDKRVITEISPSIERYGYSREALIGTPVTDIYASAEEPSALLQALLEGEAVTDYEIHLKTADGRVIDTSVSAHLLRGPDGQFLGVEGSLRDISERKRMEEALRESEAKYRGIFENVQDIYYRTDDKGIITEINPSVERFGYTREGLIGTQVLDVYPNPEERSALLQALMEREAVTDYEIHLKTGDGLVIDTSVSARLLRGPDGAFIGVEGALRDITERKRMETALREQARRDALTSVLNHGAIVQELRNLVSGDANGSSHAVAMIDVDGLKAINDTYGHQVGDAVLVAVAGGLARDGALVGRYGGDEFVALLPNTDREAAETYRQRVLDTLAEVDLRDSETGTRVQIIASVGLAIYPTEAGRIEELIKLADSAMYAWRRQRPVLSAGSTLSRAQGGDRAAKMVGQIVPLLTSLDDLNDKLRLVAHRLSVGGDYDAVNFVLFGSEGNPQGGLSTFARMPEDLVDAWSNAQRGAPQSPIRRIQERTRRAIIMDDPQNDERFTADQRKLLRTAGMRSVLIAPMIWRDELIGHLSVGSKREAAFGPRDAEFLVAVATQVTAIVRLATLVEDLQSTSTRLVQGHTETVVLLAAAAEAHDQATGLHLRSIRSITEALARELGYGEDYAEELGLAAVLHDIGKIRVPDVVLSTAGQLTDKEWDLMKQHTVWGEDFLMERPGFELAATIARSHHERWDGTGYPDGLVGKSIPTAATIVSVADAFDAMVNDRPYRSARSVAAAVREIVSCSGAQFSPKVVQSLARLHKQKKLVRLHREALIDLAA